MTNSNPNGETSSSLLAPSPKMTTSMMMDPLFFIMHTLAIHQMYTKKRGGFPVVCVCCCYMTFLVCSLCWQSGYNNINVVYSKVNYAAGIICHHLVLPPLSLVLYVPNSYSYHEYFKGFSCILQN